MFDIGAAELLLVAVVALVIIGPKDLPVAMRTVGKWLGQLRGMTSHFRVGLDAMIREAEIEEQEKIWAEKNAQVMRDHPPDDEQHGAGDPMEGQMKPLAPDGDKETSGDAPSPTPPAPSNADTADAERDLFGDKS